MRHLAGALQEVAGPERPGHEQRFDEPELALGERSSRLQELTQHGEGRHARTLPKIPTATHSTVSDV